MSEDKHEETRQAGRGLLWVGGGKVFFVATAFAVSVTLPHLFEERTFGLFSVVFGFFAMINNVLIASTLQTVSKFVSEDEARAPAALRQGLVVQAGIGLLLGGSVSLAAPWIAEGYFLNPDVTPLVRIAGGVAFAYAVYAALVGYLNGHRRFGAQARLDMTFSILRTTGLIGGASLGVGALGAMGGFGAAAASILVVALVVVGVGKSGPGVPWKRWFLFLAPIWLYQGALNGILQIDLQVLHFATTKLAREAAVVEPVAVGDRFVAFYRTAQYFAFVPYQLIIAVTFIVFPFVSKATSVGDDEAARRYIRNALRFSLLVLLSIATPIAGAAAGVLGIAFPDSYQVAEGALSVLVFGQVAFALFVISATIVTGAGRPAVAATVALIALVVVVVATYSAIQIVGIEGDTALIATAIGTSMGTSVALLLIGVVVYRGFGAFVPPLSVLRGLAAGAVAFGVARIFPHESALTAFAALVVGFFAYGATLLVLREIGREEIGALMKIVRR